MNIDKAKTYVVTVIAESVDGTNMTLANPNTTFVASSGSKLVFSTTDYKLIPPSELILWEDDGPKYALSGFGDTLRGWEISPIDVLEVTEKYVTFEITKELPGGTIRRTFKLTEMSIKDSLKNYLTK